MRALFHRIFLPAPDISLSDWADRYAVVPKTSAEPGRWRTSRAPYLREPMDAVSDPAVAEMVVMKPAQVGASVGLICNAVCYWIDVDPAPVIIVQPTQGDGEKFSKEKLQPVLEETTAIQGKVAPAKSRGGENTIRNKQFDGGWIGIIGAESPRELRSRSASRIIFDERDAYPRSSDEEGDPSGLGEKRLITFANAFSLTISTPLIKGESPTEAKYLASDQRKYFVRCPHCEYEQILEWGNRDSDYGVKWERGVVDEEYIYQPGDVVEGDEWHRPSTAAYECRSCHVLIEEHHKPRMVREGRWIAQKPGAVIRGYHWNALISLFPGAAWSAIAREFLQVRKDPEKLQVWVNTVLAETWEEKAEKIEVSGLEARAEEWWDTEENRVEVPMGVGILTAFADVQADRVEVLINGWGANEESWMIAHQRMYGDVQADPTIWARLEALRTRLYHHEGGARLRIAAFGIDSGDGQRTNAIYDWVRPRQGAGVWATKGQPERQKEPIRVPLKPDKNGIRRVDIGTYPMKATVFGRLKLQIQAGRPLPEGYMHFRARDPDWHNGADAEFFAQFGREKLVAERRPNGHWVKVYKRTGPNEAIDLEVGNLAMLHVLGPDVRAGLGAYAEQLRNYTPGRQVSMTPARKRRVVKKGVKV